MTDSINNANLPQSEGYHSDEEKTAEQRQLEETAFNRIITSVHDFCIFMRDLYIPDEAILVPPEAGWPGITRQSFARFGKSDVAIEVLRHMTYIGVKKVSSEKYDVLPDSGLTNYTHRYIIKQIIRGNVEEIRSTTEPAKEDVGPDVIGLFEGGRHTEIVLLNCKYGTVCGNGTADGGWVEGETKLVEEYFEVLKERFRLMEQLPCNSHEVASVDGDYDGIMETLREIYKQHGWPDRFRKAECAAAVKEIGRPD